MSAGRAELEAHCRAVEQAIAATGDAILGFDRELLAVYASPALGRLLGPQAISVLDRPVLEVLPLAREDVAAALDGESRTLGEHTSVRPGGQPVTFEAYVSPAPGGGLMIVRDVSQRHQLSLVLAESEARFQMMADAAPVLLWMSRTDGMCTFFNQTWLDFTGRSLEEEWGVGWAEGVHFLDLQRCLDTYLAAFSSRQPFEMEYRLRRRDGVFRWVLDRGTPRYDATGRFAGYIGSCADITDRRKLEDELRDAVQSRDEFLSIASHELRTPLTSLQLQLTHLMNQREPSSVLDRTGARLDTVERGVRRLSRLVDELLDVSRTASGSVPLQLDDVDLVEVITEVAERLRDELAAAHCTLSLQLEHAIIGRWDRLRLDQVMTNCLTNAIKYGAGRPIELTARSRGATAVFSVRDHGIGIDEADQRRIFDRFARAVSPEHYSGFGLGLWIAKLFVNAMKGEIHVDSRPGEGATFTVELPTRPLVAH